MASHKIVVPKIQSLTSRKPLKPEEVPKEWISNILWDTQGTRKEHHYYIIAVKCPICGSIHWLREYAIRNGQCQSLKCANCKRRTPLEPHEVPEEWREFILWDREATLLDNRGYGLWVICPKCKNERLVSEYDLRIARNQSIYCRHCAEMQKMDKNHGNWRGGRRQNSDGYIVRHIGGLGKAAYDIAVQMVSGKSKIILEHRLIMALHLGRPLKKYEIVHHKDGHRANNKLWNLELLTKRKHYPAHGNVYYQKWQEVLNCIGELETKTERLKEFIYRTTFSKPEVKCAFFAFFDAFPRQRVWVVDVGEGEDERQEAIEFLWHKFVDALLDVEEAE